MLAEDYLDIMGMPINPASRYFKKYIFFDMIDSCTEIILKQ